MKILKRLHHIRTFVHHRFEDLELLNLKTLLHCLVRFLPVTQDTPTFEALFLFLHRLRRKPACNAPNIRRGQTGRRIMLFQGFDLNGQAMAVPSGPVVNSSSLADLEAADDVL